MTVDRYAVTRYLNGAMMGFMEGTTDGLRDGVIGNLKRRFDMDVSQGDVKVVVDALANPSRMCWSVHVEHGGQHYESVIVNLKYDTGYEP